MTGRGAVFVCVRLILLILMLVYRGGVHARKMKCEELTIPLCKNLGYNATYMPNHFNHETQTEAGLEVHQFWPLVQTQCSPVLKYFLCFLYAPVCDKVYGKELLPCRSVCEQARAGCLPFLEKNKFVWPEKMKCDNLPKENQKNVLCMAPENPLPKKTPTGTETGTFTFSKPMTRSPGPFPSPSGNMAASTPKGKSPRTCQCTCQNPYVKVKPEWNRSIAGVGHCALPCNASLFSTEQKKFASTWITLWSSLCFLSTFLTLATYLLNTSRFAYPERPVIFLSYSYLLLSLGYIVRLASDEKDIICDNNEMIVEESRGPALCTVVFFLTYFGSMTSALWWVILSFTWFLAAGLKWSKEAISNFSQYFHVVAWLLPSVQLITVFSMSSIDGDSLSGICYVGNQNKRSLLAFVIAPLSIYLTLGTSFLVAGFVALFHIRKVMRNGGTSTHKLEKLMVRIGVFSVLYTVPATVTIGCYLYEITNRKEWQESLLCHECRPKAEVVKPEFSAFMVKYFMSLVVGISTGFWICSMKTIDSWQHVVQHCFYRRKRKSTGNVNERKETVALHPSAHV